MTRTSIRRYGWVLSEEESDQIRIREQLTGPNGNGHGSIVSHADRPDAGVVRQFFCMHLSRYRTVVR